MDKLMSSQKPRIPQSYFVILTIFALIMMLGGCVQKPTYTRDGAPNYYIDTSKIHNAVPHYLPKSKYGNRDYHVDGRWYHVLKTARGYDKRGIASWYGTKFQGRLTSTHDRYDLAAMTAASPELPIPCFVRVTNLENGRQVIVKVNDRGPFAANRIMDLSYVAAEKLGYASRGTALVEVTAIDVPNPLRKTHYEFANHHPRLYLQVGAYGYASNAEKVRYRLRRLTSTPVIIVRERRLYIVQVGPIRNVNDSDYLQQRLYHAGFGKAMTVIH